MPKKEQKKYVDKRILTIIDVYNEKRFRVIHRGTNIFFSIEDKDFACFKLLFPQRTDLQKQRFRLLDKIVRAAYDAGFDNGKNSRDIDNG